MLFPILFGRVFFLLLPLLFSPGERILLYEIMEMLSIAVTTILARPVILVPDSPVHSCSTFFINLRWLLLSFVERRKDMINVLLCYNVVYLEKYCTDV